MLQKLCRSYFGLALPAADNSCCPGMAQWPFSCQCITPHHINASSQPPEHCSHTSSRISSHQNALYCVWLLFWAVIPVKNSSAAPGRGTKGPAE